MRRSSRGLLRWIADVAIPVVVGLFLMALVEEFSADDPAPLTALGIVAGAGQGRPCGGGAPGRCW